MAHLVTGIGPTPGLSLVNGDAIMTLDTSLTCAQGDVLAVIMTTVDSSLRFYKVREALTADFATASAAANAQGYLCIAREAQTVAAGNVMCRFMGAVQALIEDTTLAVGTHLTPKNASRALDTAAATTGTGNRGVAILLEATTAANQVKYVEFDGISGVISGPSQTAT